MSWSGVLAAAIYSAHLKLHPLMVLSVLVIAEHSLGVWGLLLAGAEHASPALPVASCMPSILADAMHWRLSRGDSGSSPRTWELQLQLASRSVGHWLVVTSD